MGNPRIAATSSNPAPASLSNNGQRSLPIDWGIVSAILDTQCMMLRRILQHPYLLFQSSQDREKTPLPAPMPHSHPLDWPSLGGESPTLSAQNTGEFSPT